MHPSGTGSHALPFFEAVFGSSPTRRRMTAPLRQRIDFQFIRPEEMRIVDPALYDRRGSAQGKHPRPGSILNVRA